MISSFESSIKSFGMRFVNSTTTRKKKHRYEGKQQIAWLASHPCLLVFLGAMVDFLQEFHPISAILLIMFEYFSPLRRLSCIRRNIVRIVWKAHPGLQCYVSPLLQIKVMSYINWKLAFIWRIIETLKVHISNKMT